jgi:hypothetical protein
LLHIDLVQLTVQKDHDRNGDGSLRRGNRNDEQGEKDAIDLIGLQVIIKSDEVDIDTVQDQLDRHQHGDQVPPGEQTVHPDKEQRCADEQDMGQGDLVHFSADLAFMILWI